MSAPSPYVTFPGTTREALSAYQRMFGGELSLHTRGDLQRTDEPLDAIGHGQLTGPITIFGSDAADGEDPVHTTGLMLALLGAGDPDTSRRWFDALADGGTVVDDLQRRPWGDWDGQVIDRFGLHWLIGFQPDA